jgi:hypothetical protein
MHLNAGTALDLLEERMEPPKRAAWNDHIQGCPKCLKHLDEWKSIHFSLKRANLQDAPAADLRLAASLFPTVARRPVGSMIRTVLATMVFDSFNQAAPAGARGAAEGRQVVLRAEEFDVHIKILGGPKQKVLIGQLLPRGTTDFLSSAQLHLLRNGERIETTEVDDMGEFHFSHIPDGLISLQIDLPHLTVIGSLNIREEERSTPGATDFSF